MSEQKQPQLPPANVIMTSSFIEGGDVILDVHHEYNNCTFTKCRLIFAGMVRANNCSFTNCSWHMVGPAVGTLSLLSTLYRSGGSSKKFVEGIFSDIKDGKIPTFDMTPSAGDQKSETINE